MTEGIPASSSVTFLRKEESGPSLKYSPRKMEMAKENGRQTSRERQEVKSVPTRKGNAPNSLDTGFHVLLKKKERPKVPSDGKEYMNRLRNIAVSKTTIARADRTRDFWKTASACGPEIRNAGVSGLLMDRVPIARD